MPTIGLSMIVRDEAHVVARCLDSLRPLIDAAVVVDTGSTDGTRGVVRDWLARHGIPGVVLEEPWQDFAHNRTSALSALRAWPGIDYALVMDADDALVFEAGFDAAAFKAGLDADVYEVAIRHDALVYRRPQLVANRLAFRYRSVLHEYLDVPPEARGRATATGFHIAYGGDGGRSRAPDKFEADAALLERGLAGEADPFLRARYTFYLGQSHRDAGRRRPAIDAYLRRAELGYWDEEVFEALLNAGTLMAAEGEPTDAVLAVLDRATAAVPERAEALHAAARVCRERCEHALSVAAAVRGLGMPLPETGLFLQPWVYETGLLDEYAVGTYWLGRDIDCLVACSLVLSRPGLDAGTRARVARNRDFAHDRLAAQQSLWLGALAERAPRVAVVTPYRDETPEALRRSIESVRRQTVRADHILVADGAPQDWLDGAVARHVRLDRSSADSGNTPRAIGALLAASAGYAAIGFLDPGSWYDDDHVETCLTAALAVGLDACEIVAAGRRFRRLDLTAMPLADAEAGAFVDANCTFVVPRGFGCLASWALVPKAIDGVGDRVFSRLAGEGGRLSARTRRPTVNVVNPYAAAYRALGETPPEDAKDLPDHAGYRAWIEALPKAGIETVRHQIGLDLRGLYGPAAETASSPDETGTKSDKP